MRIIGWAIVAVLFAGGELAGLLWAVGLI